MLSQSSLKLIKIFKKSSIKKKPALLSKATLSRKEKPLITESIQRKVTEILRMGLFNKIRLLAANKVNKSLS